MVSCGTAHDAGHGGVIATHKQKNQHRMEAPLESIAAPTSVAPDRVTENPAGVTEACQLPSGFCTSTSSNKGNTASTTTPEMDRTYATHMHTHASFTQRTNGHGNAALSAQTGDGYSVCMRRTHRVQCVHAAYPAHTAPRSHTQVHARTCVAYVAAQHFLSTQGINCMIQALDGCCCSSLCCRCLAPGLGRRTHPSCCSGPGQGLSPPRRSTGQ